MNEEFLKAIRQMRKWQKEYFRTREPRAKEEAIVWEKRVDQMLYEIENPGLF